MLAQPGFSVRAGWRSEVRCGLSTCRIWRLQAGVRLSLQSVAVMEDLRMSYVSSEDERREPPSVARRHMCTVPRHFARSSPHGRARPRLGKPRAAAVALCTALSRVRAFGRYKRGRGRDWRKGTFGRRSQSAERRHEVPHHRARTRDRGPWSESFIQTAESEHVTPVTTPLTLRSFSKRACALRYCTPGRSGEVSRLLDGPNTKHGQTAAQAPRAARDGLPKGRRGFMGGYIP